MKNLIRGFLAAMIAARCMDPRAADSHRCSCSRSQSFGHDCNGREM